MKIWLWIMNIILILLVALQLMIYLGYLLGPPKEFVETAEMVGYFLGLNLILPVIIALFYCRKMLLIKIRKKEQDEVVASFGNQH